MCDEIIFAYSVVTIIFMLFSYLFMCPDISEVICFLIHKKNSACPTGRCDHVKLLVTVCHLQFKFMFPSLTLLSGLYVSQCQKIHAAHGEASAPCVRELCNCTHCPYVTTLIFIYR